MPTLFFDTSALVKRYHEKRGTERVDTLVEDGDNEVVISSLAVIETVSAFKRKQNRGELSVEDRNGLLGAFFEEGSPNSSCSRWTSRSTSSRSA